MSFKKTERVLKNQKNDTWTKWEIYHRHRIIKRKQIEIPEPHISINKI